MDEKWSFVGKKQKHCDEADPADAWRGDRWDHVALDAVHRLVLSVVPGKRSVEKVQALVADVKRRTGGRMLSLITTDEYAPYRQAVLDAYGQTVTPPRTGKRGRPRAPYKVAPPALRYATVHKTRRQGRVTKIECRVVFGEPQEVEQVLARSPVSRKINTAFVERHNGSDRHCCARKARKTYRFSKEADVHDAATYFSMYSYNFCWPVRTLRQRRCDGSWQPRTPAMAAGLTDHVWPLAEWITRPAVQQK